MGLQVGTILFCLPGVALDLDGASALSYDYRNRSNGRRRVRRRVGRGGDHPATPYIHVRLRRPQSALGRCFAGSEGQGDGYSLNNPKAFSVVEIAKAFGGPINYSDGYPGRKDSGELPEKAKEELGWETTVDVIDYIHDFTKEHSRKTAGQ